MALDEELGANDVGQGYNPDTDVQAQDDQANQSAVQGQPTDDGVPLPADQSSQQGERDWLKQLYDYTLQSFGIGSQSDKAAVPDESSAQAPTEGSPIPTDETQSGQEEAKEQAIPDDEKIAEMRKRPAIAAMGDMTGGDLGGGVHPIEALQRGLRAMVMGEGAMKDGEREQREMAAKGGAVSNVSDDAARRQALKTATTESLDTGSQLLQNYRQHHQALTGKAAAAEGMGDIRAATQLFNKAQTFAPNGVETYATPTPSGVRVATMNPDGTVQNADLNMDQFRELLHTRVGQFDHVLPEGQLQKNLANLTRSPGINVDRNTGIVSRANISTSPGAQITGGRNPNAEMASDVRAAAAGPPGKPLVNPNDMSPEGRAARQTQWASQNRPGQRERLTEKLRQQDVAAATEKEKAGATDRRLETQERIADKRIQGGLQRESMKQEAQTGRTQMTLDQRNQHLEYLKDKATQDRLSREFNADVGSFVRNMASKRANGKATTPEEDAALQQLGDRARQMRQPATSRGPAGGIAENDPAAGKGNGEWRRSKVTGERRWFSTQQ